MGTFDTYGRYFVLHPRRSLNRLMRKLLALILATATLAAAALPAVAETTGATAAAERTTTVLVRVPRNASAAVHDRAGYTLANRVTGVGIDVVVVPRSEVDIAIARYEGMPEVRYAERNRVVRLAATPNDEFVDDQYALTRIRARGGWSDYGHLWRRTGGARLAVIDTGIDRLHPEFAGRISHCRSWLTGTGTGVSGCQDTQFHGTHVAGIAAATANNRQGIAGVAFDSQIMALQAFNSSGVALTSDIVAAIVYAARNGAKVANYSFSGAQPTRSQHAAVRFAAERGVVQVAAAGNDGDAPDPDDRNVQYPAAYPQVIAVSATNSRDNLAAYSSRGRDVEVAAPGTGILSTIPGTLLYARLDGTSMAAPHVAGLAALLREQGYGPWETRRRIRAGADDLGPDGRDDKFGYGRINVARSVP